MSEVSQTTPFPDENEFPAELRKAISLRKFNGKFNGLQFALISMGSGKEKGHPLTWAERFVLSVIKLCPDQKVSPPLDHEHFKFLKIAMGTAIDCFMKDAVGELLNKGFPVNEIVTGFSSALSFAIRKNNAEIVKLLLERGANPNAEDFPNWFEAVKPSRSHLLPLLFEYGAQINQQDQNNQKSALHCWIATFDGPTEHSEESRWVLELLVRQGIDTQIKDNKGLTAQDYFRFLDNEKAGIMIPQEVARQQAQILCKSTTPSRQTAPRAPRL